MSSHEATHHPNNEANTTKTSFTASFWLVIILVGLFIASLNFINVMSHDDDGHGGGHTTTHEAAAGEGAHGAPATHEEGVHAPAATGDTMHHEEAAHH